LPSSTACGRSRRCANKKLASWTTTATSTRAELGDAPGAWLSIKVDATTALFAVSLPAGRLVIDSLEGLEPSRKCYRLINGVLVERTVGEVLPALKSTRDGVCDEGARLRRWIVSLAHAGTHHDAVGHVNQIVNVIKQLTDQYKAKAAELQEFQRKYNIQVRGEAPPVAASERRSGGSQGVLA